MWDAATGSSAPDLTRSILPESDFNIRYQKLFGNRTDGRRARDLPPPGPTAPGGRGSTAIRPPRREGRGRTDSSRRSRSRERRHQGEDGARSRRSHRRAKSRERRRSRADARVHTKRSRRKSTDGTPERRRRSEDNYASDELPNELRKDLEDKHAFRPFRVRGFDSTAAIFANYGYRSICAIRDMVGRGRDLFFPNRPRRTTPAAIV